MMKKIIYISLVFFFSQQVFSQSAMNAGGGDSHSATGSVSYSVGEVFYEPFGYLINASPGIQQVYDITIESNLPENLKNDVEIKLYPNPTTDYLELSLSDNMLDSELQISIYDMSGKQIDSFGVESKVTKINADKYSSGIYFFHIKSNNNIITTFKVVKQ